MTKRNDLLQWTGEWFQWTEDAIVVLREHFETPMYDGRMIGDMFRYTVGSDDLHHARAPPGAAGHG